MAIVTGDAGDNILTGTASADTISGLDGNDILIGGAGADTLDGGAGIDYASYAGSNAAVNVNLGTGAASGGHAAGDVLTNIEGLIGSSYGDVLTGSAGDNWFKFSAGADTINGGAGFDTMDYSGITTLGSYTYFAINLVDGYSRYGGYQVFQNKDAISNIESFIGTNFNDVYLGTAADGVFEGGAGADIINGQGGNDTIAYTRSSAGVSINLATGYANGGDATGDIFLGAYTNPFWGTTSMAAGAMNVWGSAHADTLVGNGSANLLRGNDGDDLLTGAGGNDTLEGGTGNDTAIYAGSMRNYTLTYNSGTIVVTDKTGADGIDTLTGIETLQFADGSVSNWTGTNFAPVAVNDSGINVAKDASNLIKASTILGNDWDLNTGDTPAWHSVTNVQHGTVTVLGNGDLIFEPDAGYEGIASFDYTITDWNNNSGWLGGVSNVATVTLNVVAGLVGNDDNNTLTGTSGNDRIYGEGGNDTLNGGDGDDLFVQGLGNDAINGGNGFDTVDYSGLALPSPWTGLYFALNASGASNIYYYRPTAQSLKDTVQNVESYVGSSGSDWLLGTANADVFEGGAGADFFDGNGGSDTISYQGSSAGVMINLSTGAASGGDATGDVFLGTYYDPINGVSRTAEGAANVWGSAHDDTLIGSSGANILKGGAGNDILTGNEGDDIIDGGAGDDTAVYGLYYLNYTITYSSGSLIVSTGASNYADGIDTLTNVEYLQFAANPYVTLDMRGWTGGGYTILGSDLGRTYSGTVYGDTIYGYGGNDILAGEQGNDRLIGGAGNDIYQIDRGEGIDTVVQSDIADAASTTDVVKFTAGIAYDQLWFSQSGNNLRIDVIGESSSSVLLEDWYVDTTRRVDSIQTVDGTRSLSAANVQALVDAMAAYSPPPVGQMILDSQVANDLAPVFATAWA